MKKMLLSTMLFAAFIGTAGSVMAADGEALYKSKCLMCHGADGKGTPMGPAFAGSEFVKSSADAVIADVIVKGREGDAKAYKNMALGMPAQKLSDEELNALVAYLKSLGAR